MNVFVKRDKRREKRRGEKEMKPSIRIRKKILKYSVIFKVLGIIEEEDYNRIKNYFSSETNERA